MPETTTRQVSVNHLWPILPASLPAAMELSWQAFLRINEIDPLSCAQAAAQRSGSLWEAANEFVEYAMADIYQHASIRHALKSDIRALAVKLLSDGATYPV